MVYADLETEELRFFTEEYEWEVLKDWFSDLVERYHKWLSFQSEWKEHRETSLKMLQFPYTYREGQKDLAASVYRSILRKKRLFIQAPTGVGKTLSTLFPALKAVGEGLGDKIFYLTARTITRTVAADTLDLLRKQGMRVKSVYFLYGFYEKGIAIFAPGPFGMICRWLFFHVDVLSLKVKKSLFSFENRMDILTPKIIYLEDQIDVGWMFDKRI